MDKEGNNKLGGVSQVVKAKQVLLDNNMPSPGKGFSVLFRDNDNTNLDISNLTWVKYKAIPEKINHRFDEPSSIYEYW